MVKSALPASGVPLVTASGLMHPSWYSYFDAEHKRTGGNSSDFVAETQTLTVQIQADLGDVNAGGLFRVVQGTTESGAEATIVLQVRDDTDDTFHPATIKINSQAGALSEIDVSADIIKLTASKVIIDGTLWTDGGTSTGMLAANAATDADSVPFSALASVADTTFRDCGSVTRTWSGGKAQFDFTCSIDNNDAGDHKINFRVQKDGVTQESYPDVAGRGYVCPGSNELSVTLCYDDEPSMASHTYNFQYACVAGDETTVLTLKGAMRWSDIKR